MQVSVFNVNFKGLAIFMQGKFSFGKAYRTCQRPLSCFQKNVPFRQCQLTIHPQAKLRNDKLFSLANRGKDAFHRRLMGLQSNGGIVPVIRFNIPYKCRLRFCADKPGNFGSDGAARFSITTLALSCSLKVLKSGFSRNSRTTGSGCL